MIRFIKVHGNVWIDDRKGGQTLSPTPGMKFQNEGADCIIAAGPGGNTAFLFNGKQVELGERSFINIRPDGRAFHDKAWDAFTGDVKLISGRLWARLHRALKTEGREVTGNVAVGIRG